MHNSTFIINDEPLWYKDAIIYQLHIKTFFDADNNGIGDLRGLLSKLNYLQELGCTAIWLLPFYPSPLKDDGYDIADYENIHAHYGTIQDFRNLLQAAHNRGIRIITEMVLNHTSDQHQWFQRARKAEPGTPERNFYVWSESPDKYQEARIIFKDFETSNWSWDPVARAYFWHRFYTHQPDLNFDNHAVHQAMFRVIDFWFGMGVDGMRLDAVPYLYEREGTNCENLPETHQFLKDLRQYVDKNYPHRMLLAEANQWPEEAAAYFGGGNECHMAFHFPIMPRLFMALWMEDRFPIIDILEQTPDIPHSCQWAIFLRNHDELTLEMVTDEERDYMYRMYAKDPRARINLGIRRRLAPLLNNNRRKLELMNFLLFSLPGTPIIYYGDEIGMGDNYYLGDRNGVRTPMQWSPDRNAGFSKTNPQQLYLPVIMDPEYHYEVVNVENQDKNSSSLLWWMRRVIAMRKRFKAFGQGSIQFLFPENPKVLAFTRSYENETILVIINLSRFAQAVYLNLSAYSGCLPVDLFSGNEFPQIKDTPYQFTMGMNDYFWFQLVQTQDQKARAEVHGIPELEIRGRWDSLLQSNGLEILEKEILSPYLFRSHWSRASSKRLLDVQVKDRIPITSLQDHHWLLIVQAVFAEGDPETHLLALSFLEHQGGARPENIPEHSILAHISCNQNLGILYDGLYDPSLQQALLEQLEQRQTVLGVNGRLRFLPSPGLFRIWSPPAEGISSRVLSEKHNNLCVLYDQRLCLKLYRCLEEGTNPGVEMLTFLGHNGTLANVPTLGGEIVYQSPPSESLSLGIYRDFIPNQGQGDAWKLTKDALYRFFDTMLTSRPSLDEAAQLPPSVFDITHETVPTQLQDCIGGPYLDLMAQLGTTTGSLHSRLARPKEYPGFQPEPFSTLYQRSEYQAIRTLIRRTLLTVRRKYHRIPPDCVNLAEFVLESEHNLIAFARAIIHDKIQAQKIRIHGNFNLTHVLFTGNNFAVLNFEGDPSKPLSQRRLKRSSFMDVATMIGSFFYAANTSLEAFSHLYPEDHAHLKLWIDSWHKVVSGTYLNAYLQEVGRQAFLPQERIQIQTLLNHYLLEQAFHDILYRLNTNPEGLYIPLQGLQNIMAWQ
ncbi:MAG: maltose alpha-D-glucosyltransferase [Desulfovermiculus sp.]|nr:maltose alpha-D-glucosyltransferase [Desulfovermiculus sp.]